MRKRQITEFATVQLGSDVTERRLYTADAVLPIDRRLLTFKAAAKALGVGYHKVQRGASRGLFPTYSVGEGRKYVRLCDILASAGVPAEANSPVGDAK